MTSAAIMHAIIELHQQRSIALSNLGPRPRWYRPFARRAWDAKREQLGEFFVAVARELSYRAQGAAKMSATELATERVWS